ncbi:hypothetical protein [Sorangium sp. So ce233]|uniref:hypothetical protein n=1 Tax=Sorangium sp. So ce233 TaxID=3133290 RepID=UPI003F62EBF8
MTMMKPGSRTYAGRLCSGACLALLAVTVGCGGSVIGEDDTGAPIGEDDTGTPIGEDDTGAPVGEDDTGAPVGEDDTGAPVGEDDTGAPVGEDDTGTKPTSEPGAWPKTVTLAVQNIGEAGEHVRLSDGTVSDAGDLGAHMSRSTYLQSPVEGSVCELGTSFAKLADIPTDVAACSRWASRAYLSALSIHESNESYRIGIGLLVWDAERAALYRLRVLGDSYDVIAGSTATFEYEPVR